MLHTKLGLASGDHEGQTGVVTVGTAGYWEVAIEATKAKGGKEAIPAHRQFFRRATLEVLAGAHAGGANAQKQQQQQRQQPAAAAAAAADDAAGKRKRPSRSKTARRTQSA